MVSSWRGGVLTALALLILGCGLADYESHIEKQKKRLEQIDLENKLIGEPLEMPTKPDEQGLSQSLPAQFFLRAPREIAQQAEPPPAVFPPKKADNQVWLFRFAPPKDKIDPTRPVDSLFHAVFVTTALLPEDKLKEAREEFRTNVLGAIQVYLRAGELPLKKAVWKKHPTPPLTFDALEFPAGLVKDKQKEAYLWNFFLYFHEQDDPQEDKKKAAAAIAFQVPYDKKDDDKMRKARDLSLRSLGIGGEYQTKLDIYSRWRR